MGKGVGHERGGTIDLNDQAAVIDWFEDGAGSGLSARRIDTHGAMIFLTGKRAFKIKRSVIYDYMDLSSVEKRHALLLRELDLNSPTAPTIYDRVAAITRETDGTLVLDGNGEILEWVLLMNRFPAEHELTYIANHHGISDGLARDLGDSIAAYHAAAPAGDLDGFDLIVEIIDELERVFSKMSDAVQCRTAPLLERLRQAAHLRKNDLRHRSVGGHVRRCHGDLHLRNIVMIDGVPTPYDALEFDERLGTCDTLYDLAFLLMDLDHLGLDRAANGVLNAYLLGEAQDIAEAGLALLPLFLSVRAAIRAMVDLQTAAVTSDGADLAHDAKRYISQASEYLFPRSPVLVAIGGLSGTGKTTIARAIAHRIGARPGAIHLRTDVIRKALMGVGPRDRLGAEGYADKITTRTYGAMREAARKVLIQGHSVIIDAVHGSERDRRASERTAKDAGCAFCGIWLDAPTKVRTTRVEARQGDASDADAGVVARQASLETGPVHWHRVATDRPLAEAVAAVISVLQSPNCADRPREAPHVG